jgi:myo-inositol 2-dehydrogenase / D-chiro-inositol 1-dehydrogenase
MADIMRFGIVGYGAWGRFHTRAIAKLASARVAAIATPSDASAHAAHADFPDAVIHRDWRTLIGDTAIDAVAIATPNHLHAEIAIAALDAHKHVLVEKPMANTIADCDRVVAAAARSKSVLTVGLECRLSPQWGRIKSLIAEGAIGTPRHVHVALFRHPYRPGSGGWRYDRGRVGSWILEEPVHFFDLALWYLADAGRPVRVHALGAGAAGMEPVISVSMRFPNGATVAINQILSGFGHLQTVEVAGDGGAIRATWAAETARSLAPFADLRLMRAGAQEVETIAIERSGEVYELEAQAAAVVEAFSTGRPVVSAEDGRAAVALCLAAEQSVLENGREIVVS